MMPEHTKEQIQELYNVSHRIALSVVLGLQQDEKELEKFRTLNREVTGINT